MPHIIKGLLKIDMFTKRKFPGLQEIIKQSTSKVMQTISWYDEYGKQITFLTKSPII